MSSFVTERLPPAGRQSKCDGPLERHLYEPAVMLAVTRWMFGKGAAKVWMYPDGMHAKQFDICGWLTNEGFEKVTAKGTTRVAGMYSLEQQTLVVEFNPGHGDVVADVDGCRVVVEAKGGILNTRHPGQKSKLRRHLFEAIGMLLDGPADADRLIAAVPRHAVTETIAHRIARRCGEVGIEIALISEEGDVQLV